MASREGALFSPEKDLIRIAEEIELQGLGEVLKDLDEAINLLAKARGKIMRAATQLKKHARQ